MIALTLSQETGSYDLVETLYANNQTYFLASICQLTAIKQSFLSDMELDTFDSQTFLEFAQTDLALLHTVLLSATSLYAGAPGDQEGAVDLLELEALTVVAIKDALKESARATSDQLITAVAMMALYDLRKGNNDRFKTHTAGLTQMIKLRGGLREFRSDCPLKQLVLLIENATRDRGSKFYIER